MTTRQNQRSLDDRRMQDGGPPQGWKERRRTVERRRPVVTEISFREWIMEMVEWRELSRARCS